MRDTYLRGLPVFFIFHYEEFLKICTGCMLITYSGTRLLVVFFEFNEIIELNNSWRFVRNFDDLFSFDKILQKFHFVDIGIPALHSFKVSW